jgi:hypothetical protein
MNIFTLSDKNDLTDKINLDDLFEKKREIAENKLQLYNKILNRIHTKIKITSRQNQGKEQFCWYLIPEMMIGVSRYDVAECTGYILRKLRENDFIVRYTNPNLIFISWKHWVPGYVRQEYKKQTGQTIDGFGNEVIEANKQIKNTSNPNNLLLNNSNSSIKIDKNKNKDYNSVKNYKPSGIYNNDLLQKIQDKFEPK